MYARIQDNILFCSRGTSASPKIAIISLILTFSWRSPSRPARSHEYPLCSSEEGESTHPIEDKIGDEREGGRKGGREGEREERGREKEGERDREKEREGEER